MDEFLAIDIGASSGRHILGKICNGRLVTEEIYRFPNSPLKVDGRLVWDTGRLFAEIITGLKRAKELGAIPVSVGIDTWAVDYVLLGKDGEPVDNVFSYRDPKTERAVREVHGCIPFEDLYGRTGIQFQPFNTIYRLKQDALDGRLARAEQMLMLPDYFHYLLTGKTSREYTNATSTGLINAATHTWDREITQALGLPERLFPQTAEAGVLLGEFTEEIRRLTGFGAKVVLPATHDTASAVVGSVADGGPYLSSGTWSLLGIEQSKVHTDEKSRRFNYSNEGHIGGRYRFQKNLTGLWMVNRLRAEECPQMSFAEFTALAERSENEYLVDVNDARFLAPEHMRREIEDAVGRSLSAGECAYTALNSLAHGYRKAVGELESVLNESFAQLNVIGGGSKNALLNRLTERSTGKKIIAGPSEATVVGNLVMQMITAGVLHDHAEAKKIIMQTFYGEL